jgi:hypothetical protein
MCQGIAQLTPMNSHYYKPVWDSRLSELDILIADDNRRKNRVRTGTEQTEARIETPRQPEILNSPEGHLKEDR